MNAENDRGTCEMADRKKPQETISLQKIQQKMFRTQLKTDIKKYEAAVNAGDVELAQATYKAATKKIDKAAARKKSQFTKKLNAMG